MQANVINSCMCLLCNALIRIHYIVKKQIIEFEPDTLSTFTQTQDRHAFNDIFLHTNNTCIDTLLLLIIIIIDHKLVQSEYSLLYQIQYLIQSTNPLVFVNPTLVEVYTQESVPPSLHLLLPLLIQYSVYCSPSHCRIPTIARHMGPMERYRYIGTSPKRPR